MVVTGCYRVCRSSYTPLGDVYHVGSAHVLHGHDDVIFTMMSMLYATSHTPVPGPAGWLLFGVNGVLGTRPAPVPRTDSERQCTVLSTVEVDAFQVRLMQKICTESTETNCCCSCCELLLLVVSGLLLLTSTRTATTTSAVKRCGTSV